VFSQQDMGRHINGGGYHGGIYDARKAGISIR
jgi:hypothetical protein